jgi:ABC-type nitrate/sulfonate/bicarbonate transport system substrate-binding protein
MFAIRSLVLFTALAVSSLAIAEDSSTPLRVYGNTSTLELAPVLLAAERMGPDAITVSNGGVANLFKDGEADVATNAETQALRVSVKNPNLRIIFTVAEGFYRIVGRKSAGIEKLADLKGKKIGTVPSTSSAYYLHKMLATVGLSESDVTVVPLVPLTKIPTALSNGEVDAVTIWEPEIQNAAEAIGEDAIEFQDRSVYRELFNLNTTAEQLANPAKRQQIVAFVAELIKASEQIRNGDQEAISLAAKSTGFDPELIEKVWHHEGFHGTLVHDLADVMADEEVWLSKQERRRTRSRAEIVDMIDPSVRLEALALLNPATSPQESSLADAQQRIDQLAVNADNVDGIRAVKRLQHIYAQYMEQGQWNDLADLFADKGVAQFDQTIVEGKDAVRLFFTNRLGRGVQGLGTGRLNLRMVLSPVVNLSADGSHAKARWHEVAMLGEYGKSANWQGGIYENEYVRENGVWKIATLHFYPNFAGSYETGWRSTSETPFVVPFHYTAQTAGIPIPDEARRVVHAEAPQTLPTLSTRLGVLEHRLARVNDASEVQNLQNIYGYYFDRKMWEDLAELFASKNATMELGLSGVYVGKASIRRALDQFGKLRTGELNDHLQLEPVINVAPDGKTAQARGIQLSMTSYDKAGQWTESIYNNDYVKEDGKWKIRSVHIYQRFISDYYVGWMTSALPAPPASADFVADRLSTQLFTTYPHTYFPPIRYSHPVNPPFEKPLSGKHSQAHTVPELMTRITEAERQLAIAEAYDGAENISNAYGYYIDEFQWDNMADVFSRDGWKELSYIGTYISRERIRQSVKMRYGEGGRTGKSMTLHQKTQPVVNVAPDGQSARIRERLLQINSVTDAPGSYIGGIYENEIVKEDGVWKIAGMDLDYVWTASYVNGWARAEAADSHRFAPTTGAPLAVPPDRPLRGVVVAPFPTIVDVPFHYRNPVSNRAPPVLLLPSERAP